MLNYYQKSTANLYNANGEGLSPREVNLEVYFYFLGSVSSVFKRQKTLFAAIARIALQNLQEQKEKKVHWVQT